MSDDDVIKAISRQCVPVAINRELISIEKSPVGDLYRDIQKQRPNQYQGIYVIDPKGKVLANQAEPPKDEKLWAKDLRDRIDSGVKAYGRSRNGARRNSRPWTIEGRGRGRTVAPSSRSLFDTCTSDSTNAGSMA